MRFLCAEWQAQDRCHRIGQTRDVSIYRLVSSRTIEENILKKAQHKVCSPPTPPLLPPLTYRIPSLLPSPSTYIHLFNCLARSGLVLSLVAPSRRNCH